MTPLLARLEGATSGSRELDCYIHRAVDPGKTVLFDPGDVRERRPASYGELRDYPLDGWMDWGGVAGTIGAPRCTTSLDAAVALCERLLPGYWWRVERHPRRYGSEAWASVWQEDEEGTVEREATAWAPPGQPALALCKAIVAAWSAQQERGA
jgi:hypothetical protein